MLVPRYKKHRGWLRFFAGIALGIFIGWGFFVTEYGASYDQFSTDLSRQESEISFLKQENTRLIEDIRLQNEENANKLVIQKVSVSIINSDKHRLSQLHLYELKQQVLQELVELQGVNIETIEHVKDVLRGAIENKTYEVNGTKYTLVMRSVYVYTTLQIDMEIISVKDT
ncbi:sporulation membrane protein YtrI [Shouchella lonarensis]|uniref:Sporulation membrane protein YtrI C-terminal domain-containing protein n=1 Tax=Shouchella lonarensis TaxID=1464122 RepID=A0A1G6GN02_9BACI|nr:sporulation membrane protein YtrI [Shouchella lonarensis]SDB83420.1 hypothetical protein SAMN05421737_101282 [Shouchella lonarensis]